jgi:nucleotide-binding universal stress UspA family protein
MQWPPRRILVGTDFSNAANTAVAFAFDLARRTGATVELVHAIDPRGPHGGGYRLLDRLLPASDTNLDPVRTEADRALRALAAEHAPPTASTRLAVGEAAAEILATRMLSGADLVVLGGSGLRGLRHFLLGSVADRVMRRPGCPLLLVNEMPASGRVERVLVGAEYPDRPTPWLRTALDAAHVFSAELTVAHVPPARGYTSDRHHVDLEPEKAGLELERLLASELPELSVQIAIERGDPAQLLPDLARRLGSQLVVIGAERNAEGWPGRVADRVARAGLPAVLLVWPPPEADEEWAGE